MPATGETEPHFGKADFEQLCNFCDITRLSDSQCNPVGMKLDVFIAMSVSGTPHNMFLHVGTMTTSDPQRVVSQKLQQHFPSIDWRVAFSVFA